MNRLLGKAAFSLVIVLAFMAILIFGCAGTVDYWQGWVFLTIYCAFSIFIVIYLWMYDKALLERRMTGGPWAEGELAQKVIMFFACLCFIGLMVVPALDHRWKWSDVPL